MDTVNTCDGSGSTKYWKYQKCFFFPSFELQGIRHCLWINIWGEVLYGIYNFISSHKLDEIWTQPNHFIINKKFYEKTLKLVLYYTCSWQQNVITTRMVLQELCHIIYLFRHIKTQILSLLKMKKTTCSQTFNMVNTGSTIEPPNFKLITLHIWVGRPSEYRTLWVLQHSSKPFS